MNSSNPKGYNSTKTQQIIKDCEKFTQLTKSDVIPIDSPEDRL